MFIGLWIYVLVGVAITAFAWWSGRHYQMKPLYRAWNFRKILMSILYWPLFVGIVYLLRRDPEEPE